MDTDSGENVHTFTPIFDKSRAIVAWLGEAIRRFHNDQTRNRLVNEAIRDGNAVEADQVAPARPEQGC